MQCIVIELGAWNRQTDRQMDGSHHDSVLTVDIAVH